ncbi:MAG: ABC transporter ATP-binding protein [bacterium]
MLEVKDISFSYGVRETLGNITFDVASGEIVAVVGANGAGKTTLLRLLSCLLMQDSGHTLIDGIDSVVRPIAYRSKIGFLSEKCPLYDEMTVEEYLTYRLKIKGERQLRVRRRLEEVLALCRLDEHRKTVIRLLSYGYRKRVGLADVLTTHPGVLLLDDPLAGMDLPQRKQVAEVLTSVSGRSLIVIAGHEITFLLEWCTRFLVLYRGRIVGMHRVRDYERDVLLKKLEQQIMFGKEEGGLP